MEFAVTSADREFLLAQATRCQHLAGWLVDDEFRRMMNELEREYRDEAAASDRWSGDLKSGGSVRRIS